MRYVVEVRTNVSLYPDETLVTRSKIRALRRERKLRQAGFQPSLSRCATRRRERYVVLPKSPARVAAFSANDDRNWRSQRTSQRC